jgi:hypothetical protein
MNIELVQQIRDLSREDRLSLLRELVKSLEAEEPKSSRTSSLARVRGLLKTETPPPSDEQVRESYVQYLIEKYQLHFVQSLGLSQAAPDLN